MVPRVPHSLVVPPLCNVSRVPTIPALVHVISAVWHIPTLPFESLTHEKSSYFIVRTSGCKWRGPQQEVLGPLAAMWMNLEADSAPVEPDRTAAPANSFTGTWRKLWARIIQLHSSQIFNTQKLWDNQCFFVLSC